MRVKYELFRLHFDFKEVIASGNLLCLIYPAYAFPEIPVPKLFPAIYDVITDVKGRSYSPE